MTHAIAFLLGMAAIPFARLLWTAGCELREHWKHLDYYDTPRKREHTSALGRAIHRAMRALKRGRPC